MGSLNLSARRGYWSQLFAGIILCALTAVGHAASFIIFETVNLGNTVSEEACGGPYPPGYARQLCTNLGLTTAGTFSKTVLFPSVVFESPYYYSYEVTFKGNFGFAGSILPKYQVVSVWYAPPGNVDGSHSSVTYGSSFTTGTSTSNSQSWSVASSVGVSGIVNIFGSGGSGTVSAEWTEEQDTSSSLDLESTSGQSYVLSGPTSTDGLDHDEDVVWIWLNPVVNMSLYTNLAETTSVAYNSADPDGMDVIYLTVSQLKQLASGLTPQQIPSLVGSAPRLNREWDTSTGPLTATDYTQILNADPFVANPSLNPAVSTRFDNLGVNIPYEPSDGSGGSPLGTTYSTSYSSTSTQGQGATDSYKVSYATQGEEGFLGLAEAKLDVSLAYTYTNKWSASIQNKTTQNAQVVVYGPLLNDNYVGPTNYAVYKDNVYGTFAFYGPPD